MNYVEFGEFVLELNVVSEFQVIGASEGFPDTMDTSPIIHSQVNDCFAFGYMSRVSSGTSPSVHVGIIGTQHLVDPTGPALSITHQVATAEVEVGFYSEGGRLYHIRRGGTPTDFSDEETVDGIDGTITRTYSKTLGDEQFFSVTVE